MKFNKEFLGVPNGEIYPVQYKKGDTVPPELEEAAIAAGCVEQKETKNAVKNGKTQTPPNDSESDENTQTPPDNSVNGENND